MRLLKRLVFFGIFLLCSWAQGIRANPADDDRRMTAIYAEGEIVVDGNLDEPEWRLAQPATDFVQSDPRMGEPATERTEVRILYDDENLYLGVYCFDSAGEQGLIITDVRRDFVVREIDYFSVAFDTFNDNRNAFLFG